MAYGVPIVTEARYGWLEMLDEQSALFGETWEEIGELAATLESNEAKRLSLADAARERLETIANPETIWTQWEKVLHV